MDMDVPVIESREQLMHYSTLVAGSVGMVMACVLDAATSDALDAARDLGIAMQLTNILRDVAEDLDRGRIYLPADELLAAGCSTDSLKSGITSPGLRRVMSDIASEARCRYERGKAGIPALDPSAQFAISLAAHLYSQILVKIESRDFDVFSGRASLGSIEKWTLALPAYARHRLQTARI